VLALADPRAKPDASEANVDGAPLSAEAQSALRGAGVRSAALKPAAGDAARRVLAERARSRLSRTDKSDGSSAVTVKKPLLAWDAKIGADIASRLRPAPATSRQVSAVQGSEHRATGKHHGAGRRVDRCAGRSHQGSKQAGHHVQPLDSGRQRIR
jgi:hypothetical protein